eukprot:scaffold7457_cov390-Prasinococcus_capsulatus_cf.AAC.2
MFHDLIASAQNELDMVQRQKAYTLQELAAKRKRLGNAQGSLSASRKELAMSQELGLQLRNEVAEAKAMVKQGQEVSARKISDNDRQLGGQRQALHDMEKTRERLREQLKNIRDTCDKLAQESDSVGSDIRMLREQLQSRAH